MEFRNETNELTSRTPRSDSLLCRGTVLAILISAAVCLYRKWFIFSLSDPVNSEKLSHPACQVRPSHRRCSFFTADTTTRLGSWINKLWAKAERHLLGTLFVGFLLFFSHLNLLRSNSYSSAISASTEIIHKLQLQTWQNNACCKTLINDLTFRMPQHTSSEVTVG